MNDTYSPAVQPVDTRDLLEVLESILPEVRFHAYTCHIGTNLYICGFLEDDVLVGGYALTTAQIESHFVVHCLNLTAFFQKAWSGEAPRFYPEEMQTMYEVHRESAGLWRQLA